MLFSDPGGGSLMTVDIFDFWSLLDPTQKIHPDDAAVFGRIPNRERGFDLKCLPVPFYGRLRTAPVVLLFASPGVSKFDYKEAKSHEAQQRYAIDRKGCSDLPDNEQMPTRWGWWTRITNQFCHDWKALQSKIAFLNISPYHYEGSIKHRHLLAAL